MSRLRLVVLALLAGPLLGCVKDPTSVSPVVPVPSAKGVYIINEGNFGRGNSTLSYYNLETFHVYNDVFFAVNGRNLGDVGESMTLHQGRGYIVVNDSHKIEIIDLNTNVDVGTIDLGAGSSPRQMVFVNDTLALVTDLYESCVFEVDVKHLTVLGSIPVGQNPEGIVLAAGKAFVANSGFGVGQTVSVVSVATLSLIDSVLVADNPIGMRVTPGGMVYAVCAGSYGDYSGPNSGTPARIMVIDPQSDRVVDSIYIGGHASAIAIGDDGIGYVPATDSVLTIDTRINAVRGAFVQGGFYGVGVEEVSGDVYLSDAKQFIQPGTVYVYASNGVLRTKFDVGISPGSFAFKR